MKLFNKKEQQTKEISSVEIMVEPNQTDSLNQNNASENENQSVTNVIENQDEFNDENRNEDTESKTKLLSKQRENNKSTDGEHLKNSNDLSNGKNKKQNLFNQSIFAKLTMKFLKYFIFLLLVYLFGYFGLSFAWILVCLTIYFIRLGHKTRRQEVMIAEQDLALNERKVIERLLVDLPNWVYFPDSERVEWMNKLINQLWPFLDLFVKKIVRESVLPNLVSYLPNYMKGLHFEEIDLGTIPLKIGSIKCHTERSSRNEILLDMQILYAGNSKFTIRCFKFAAGIKDLQLFGQLRVRLFPLIEHSPLIGAISCTFLNCPKVDFNLTSLADFFDLPGLSDLIRKAIIEQISSYIVYPNTYVMPLTNIPIKQLKFSEPVGIVRLEIIEARNLKKSDYGMLGMGKSDPYCKVFISSYIITTQVVPVTVNPQWNYICEVALGDLDDQVINIEVYDQDQGTSDDFLGRVSLKISDYDCSGDKNYWVPLEDTDTGLLNIRLTWFKLITDLTKLDNQLKNVEKIKTLYSNTMSKIKSLQQKSIDTSEQTEVTFGSVFCCMVYLDCIRHLPKYGQSQIEPNTFVDITFGNRKRRSITCESNCNPVFEQSFIFLCGSLQEEPALKFEIVESKSKQVLGETAINLLSMITKNETLFNKPIHVKVGQTSECILRVTIELRLLCQENIQNYSSKTNLNKTDSNEKNNPIVDPPISDQIPSLDNMVYSTVLPFVKTMEYKVEEQNKDNKSQSDKPLEKFNQFLKNSTYIRKINNKPQINITFDNLKDKNFNPILLTIHRAINLPELNSQNSFYFIKINRFPSQNKKKIVTKKINGTNCPSFDQTFALINSKKNPIIRLELRFFKGKPQTIKKLFSQQNIQFARVVINLTEFNQSKITKSFDLENVSSI